MLETKARRGNGGDGTVRGITRNWRTPFEHMKEKRSRLLETMERKQKLRNGAEVENELHGAQEELRILEMERRKTEAEWLRVVGAAGAEVRCEVASGAENSKAEVGEPGVDVDWKGSLADQSARISAGG